MAKRTIPRNLDRAGAILWLILDTLREISRPETAGAITWLGMQRLASRVATRAPEWRAELEALADAGVLRRAAVPVRRWAGRWIASERPGYGLAETGGGP